MKPSLKLLFLVLLIHRSSFGQVIPDYQLAKYDTNFVSKIINKSKYVFEGIIIDTMYYNGETGRRDDLYFKNDFVQKKVIHSCKPLTSHKIQITHIYRGDLKEGTIDLVIEGGIYTHYGLFINEPDKAFRKMEEVCDQCFDPMRIGSKGIFFCSKIPLKWEPSPMQTDNEIRVVPVEIIENYFNITGWAKGFGKIFRSKQEIYDFLKLHENITIPEEKN